MAPPSDRGARCLGQLFATSSAGSLGEGGSGRVTAASTFTAPVAAQGQRVGAVNARIVFTSEGQQVPADFSLAFVFQGDAAVSLVTLATGDVFPRAQRAALLRTLSSRLAAAG